MEKRHSFTSAQKLTTKAVFKQVADRQIKFRASTSAVDRVGDIVEPQGIDLRNYKSNPVMLRDHDPSKPVARVSGLGVNGNALEGFANFPPVGASPVADETLALIRAEILRGISIGFDPDDFEPLPGGGRRYKAIELLEISIVAIPANQDSLVLEKAYRGSSARSYGRSMSRAEREAEVMELRRCENVFDQRAIAQAAALGPAHFCDAVRRNFARDVLKMHELTADRGPMESRAARVAEMQRLRRS